MAAWWVLIGFLSGSLPFSVWIAKWALHVDIRRVGDGNPGATNVFRAGGKGWGWLAILLDALKGAVPVGFAHYGAQLEGWWLVAAGLAPIFGHAFSPLLRFKGGKAIAVTYGSWMGLSLWVVPVTLGAIYTIFHRILRDDRKTIIAGQVGLVIAFLLMQVDWTWYAVWTGSTLIYMIKHPPQR